MPKTILIVDDSASMRQLVSFAHGIAGVKETRRQNRRRQRLDCEAFHAGAIDRCC